MARSSDTAADVVCETKQNENPPGNANSYKIRGSAVPDIEQLASIFAAYNETTDRMRASHQQLQSEVGLLREQLRQKNEQLERKNRLAALGEMAAGMAHEIRNPLGGIQLYASLLERDLIGQKEQLNWVRKISKGVQSLDSIVNDILAFTHDQICNKQESLISELLTEVMDYILPHNGPEIELDLEEVTPDLRVQMDPNMMRRVFLNLIRNAIDAMDGRGKIKISADICNENPLFKVLIRIADNGRGITPEVMNKMFNPFFTTKDTGTGLGLAIVHRLVECHNGVISASNNETGGATFTILLP